MFFRRVHRGSLALLICTRRHSSKSHRSPPIFMDLDAVKIETSTPRSGDSRYIFIDDCQSHAHSASSKIGEACIPLDRLDEFLRHRFLQDGRSDYEGLLEEIRAFVKTGNCFSIPCEKLSNQDPRLKMIRSNAEELKKRYDKAIALEEKKREIVGLALLVASPLVIALAKAFPKSMEGQWNLSLAALVATSLSLIKIALDLLEAARKSREDATKKKCEGAATVRGLASSFEYLKDGLTQILPSYEELMKEAKTTTNEIKRMIDHQLGRSELELRTEVTNLTWLVEKNKRKAKEIKDRAEEVEKCATNAAKDVSVLNILEDLAELLNDLHTDTKKNV